MEQQAYEEAIDYFLAANLYEDSQSKLQECYYQLGLQFEQEESYSDASTYYALAKNHQDAPNRLAVCQHLEAVKNDTCAPNLSGLNQDLQLTLHSNFNFLDYIKKHLIIKDDVSDNLTDYEIHCDNTFWDVNTGKVSSSKAGSYTVEITAADEAGNIGRITIQLSLELEPVRITVQNPTPIIYDGEYGKIQLKKFKHMNFYGEQEFYFEFEVENNTNKTLELNMGKPHTTINRYQVTCWRSTGYNIVGPGNIARPLFHILDKEIPSEVGEFTEIKSTVFLHYQNSNEALIAIPVIFEVAAAYK